MTDLDKATPIEPIAATAIDMTAVAPRRLALPPTFSALRHRNYRLYFVGQMISLTGMWMQNIAQSWLVYQLTESPLYLGIVSFASSIPVLALSLIAGVYVDRVPKRWLLVRTQTAAMILAFILAADVFLGWVQPLHVIILSFLLGIVNAFDGPARQSFVVEMVGREDMSNAIALNSTNFNSARIFGPSLAGIMLALVGPAWCFFVSGVGFIGTIIALKMMRMEDKAGAQTSGSVVLQAREGLAFVKSHQIVRMLIAIIAVSNLFAFGYSALLPAFAQDVLDVGPIGLGWMSAALGAGAMSGALISATFGKTHRKGRLLTAGNILFPTMVMLFAFSTLFPLSMVLLFFAGTAFMIQNNMTNTLIQVSVPDHLRGRVMSVYMLIFMGFYPIGALIAGAVAERTTIPLGAAFGASIGLAFGIFWLLRAPYLRALQ